MLSFNAILNQSRAMQSLKNFRRRLRGGGGVLCWCSLRSQMSDQVLFPYLQHYKLLLYYQDINCYFIICQQIISTY